MEKVQHEQYEYARRRIRQKKHLYFHFVVFIIAGLFAFIANHFFLIGAPYQWYKWLVCVWLFVFILHFINIFITKRFMNKTWERQQIDRLVTKQRIRIAELDATLEHENPKQNS